MKVHRGKICNNVFNYVNVRQGTACTRLTDSAKEYFSALHLPEAVKENELTFGEYDKIFAAQWLNEDHIICGTKCNNVRTIFLFIYLSILSLKRGAIARTHLYTRLESSRSTYYCAPPLRYFISRFSKRKYYLNVKINNFQP